MNVVSVKTAYSNVEEYKFELDILRDSLLTPERPLDVLREDVFKTQRAIKPLPSLEERRKELSRLVSEDYQIEYNNELQLRVNEYLLDTDDESDGISKRIADITVNPDLKGIFSYNNNLEQADLEALYEKYGLDDEADFDKGLGSVTGIQGSVETNTLLVTSENQIEHLGKTSVDTELEVPNISSEDTTDEPSTDETSADVQPIEEPDVEVKDSTNEPKGIDNHETEDNAEDSEFEEASDEEDVDDLEDEDLEDDIDEDDSADEADLVDDSEDIDEEDSADEFEDEDEDLEDEDSIDEDEDLEDEDGIDNDEDVDSEDEDLEDDDSEDEDLEDTENIDEIELDNTVVKPIENSVSQQSKHHTSNSPRDGNKLDNSSTLIDNILDSDDEVDLEKFNANIENSGTDNNSKGTANSSQISAQSMGIDESDTKDLRQFLRNNPRCDYNDVLKYFSKREITRELSRGRIIKKGSKLKPI